MLDALGHALADPIVAELDLPAFTNSAMDGFAVQAADTVNAGPERPITLRVVGRVPAGAQHLMTVGPGEAASIATGAPIPPGADAVVRIEEVSAQEQRITLIAPVTSGRDIRPTGEDVQRGARMLDRGHDVRAAEIALLVALGRTHVRVHARPRVALLTTGDELVPGGQPMGPGQLHDANLPALVAQTVEAGGIPTPLVPARDDEREVRARIEQGLGYDALVVSAGVSVGDRDYVRSCLAAFGPVQSWRLRMRPVRPFAFAPIGRTLVFALPGNPVASALAFELLVRPAVRAVGGHARTGRPGLLARLEEPIDNRGGLLTFVRGALDHGSDEPTVRSAGGQGTADLATLARTDCLILVPETCERLEAGTRVRVRLLSGDA